MDSLGGILTGGLLGNPIIGYFNLKLFNLIEIEVQEYTGGNSSSYPLPRVEEDRSGRVIIKIHLFKKDYQKYYTFSEGKINIIVRMLKFIKKIQQSVINIRFRQTKIDKIQVKFNEKD